ncbi:MAG: hypothetical protein ABIO49_15180 [Dokdonella sp.]
MHVVPVFDNHSLPSLEFHMTYTGTQAIKVGSSSVPGNRIAYSVHFEVESFSRFDVEPFYACPPPKKRYIVDDPGHNEILLEPGKDYVQRIDLADHVANLSELVGKCDLVVFWAHKLDVVEKGLTSQIMAGAVVIPRSNEAVAPADGFSYLQKTKSD